MPASELCNGPNAVGPIGDQAAFGAVSKNFLYLPDLECLVFGQPTAFSACGIASSRPALDQIGPLMQQVSKNRN